MNVIHLRMGREIPALIITAIIFIPSFHSADAGTTSYTIQDIGEPYGVPAGIVLDVPAQRIYWADRFNGTISAADFGIDGIVYFNEVTEVVPGLLEPEGIALDEVSGKLYWTDVRAHSIQRANLDGTNIETLVTGLGTPYRLAIDTVQQMVYWTDPDAGKIQRMSLLGGPVEDFMTYLPRPWGIAVDPAAGRLFWSDTVLNQLLGTSLANPMYVLEVPLLSFERIGDICIDPVRQRVGYLYVSTSNSSGSGGYVAERNYDGTERASLLSIYTSWGKIESVGLAIGHTGGNAIVFRSDIRPAAIFGNWNALVFGQATSRATTVNDQGEFSGAIASTLPCDYQLCLYETNNIRLPEVVFRGTIRGSNVLGDLIPADSSRVGLAIGTSISSSGVVAGFSDGMTEFVGTPPATSAVLPGYSFSSRERAFVTNGDTLIDIGTLGSVRSFSLGFGINDASEVVGYSYDDVTIPRRTRGFLYENGNLTGLETLGGYNSYAFAINNARQIVGRSETGDGEVHAFQRDPYTLPQPMTDLGTLGGPFSQANDINSQGQIVGESWTADHKRHAFLFSGRQMIDLGTLGGEDSVALAINDSGIVVGKSTTATGEMHAFVYQNGVMRDLNAFIPPDSRWTTLISANDINTRGQIVGDGEIVDLLRPFMLTPVAPGDVNCDGSVDETDFAPFVQAMLTLASSPYCNTTGADVNGDDLVDGQDIQFFIDILLND